MESRMLNTMMTEMADTGTSWANPAFFLALVDDEELPAAGAVFVFLLVLEEVIVVLEPADPVLFVEL